MDEAIPTMGIALRESTQDFEDFFAGNRDRLTRALWLVARDRYEAEEVAQDAFVKVWERWDRVSAIDDPQAYLFRTALNLYRNRRRRAALALRRFVRFTPPADPIGAIDERDAILRAIGTLTPKQRTALVLTDLLELTSEEAARACPPHDPVRRRPGGFRSRIVNALTRRRGRARHPGARSSVPW